jgi:hypothetical protein
LSYQVIIFYLSRQPGIAVKLSFGSLVKRSSAGVRRKFRGETGQSEELVPGEGVEPTRISPADFKSAASANSATPASNKIFYLLIGKYSTFKILSLICYDDYMRKVLKFIGMVIGTAVAGGIFGVLAALLLSWLMKGEIDGWGGLVGVIMGLALGYPLGVFLGIVIFKKLLRYNGSLILGLIGVILGGALPFILAEPLGLNNHGDLLWLFIIVISPLLGTIGFNLRKKTSKESASLS